jgi:membrane associated rhomboid family serine protease
MFPYRDDNPRVLPPVTTGAIIALNVVAWVLIQSVGVEPALSRSICQLGLIPGELLGRVPEGTAIPLSPQMPCTPGGVPTWLTPLTSMFLHGSWFHLIGNMWFLWLFGDNIEGAMGHGRFGLFYLLAGLAAAAAQIWAGPSSPLPMVGASGAISGVMGAYIVLFPRVKVHMIVFLGFLVTRAAVPAYLMLGYWFLLQLLGGLPGLAVQGGGVAFWAHVGGFLAGALLVTAFKSPRLMDQRHKLMELAGWQNP